MRVPRPSLGFVLGMLGTAVLGACYGGSSQAGNANAPAYALSYYGGPVVAYGYGGGMWRRGTETNPRWSNTDAATHHRGHHDVEYGHHGVYGGGPPGEDPNHPETISPPTTVTPE